VDVGVSNVQKKDQNTTPKYLPDAEYYNITMALTTAVKAAAR
jgi:hypothetical protein